MFTSTFCVVRNDPDDVVHLTESDFVFFSVCVLEALISVELAPESKRIFKGIVQLLVQRSPKTIGTNSTDIFCRLFGGEIKWR
jgi:hypothetical protein